MATHTTYTHGGDLPLSLSGLRRDLLEYHYWQRYFIENGIESSLQRFSFLFFPFFGKVVLAIVAAFALVVVVNVVDPLVRERKSPPLGIHRKREREKKKRHPIPFSTAAQVYKVYLCKRLK